MLLKNGEVVPAVEEIEGNVGLFCVLVKRPAAVSVHGHVTIDPFSRCQLLDELGNIAVVGVAVADEQDLDGFHGRPPDWF